MTTPAGQGQEGSVAAAMKAAEDMPIKGWMEVFRQIYQEVDSKRTPVQMWVAATAHFTTMGEAIRRMNFTDLMHSAAHAFCWMCSFILACEKVERSVFSLKESFSDVVGCKYPLCCGHCQASPCACKPKDMDKEANKAAGYRVLLERRAKHRTTLDAYSVSAWAGDFNDIYGQHVHMLPLESIGFHFLEEAGEELTAIRDLLQLEKVLREHIPGIDEAFLGQLATFEGVVALYEQYESQKPEMQKRGPEAVKTRLVHAKVDMFVEFADTFSWFCSIQNKVMSIARNCGEIKCAFKQEAFAKKMEDEYLPDGKPRCPSCRACPCDCLFYN